MQVIPEVILKGIARTLPSPPSPLLLSILNEKNRLPWNQTKIAKLLMPKYKIKNKVVWYPPFTVSKPIPPRGTTQRTFKNSRTPPLRYALNRPKFRPNTSPPPLAVQFLLAKFV